jgi:aminoglycoside phosphotransferase (APT) family kinase protein
MDDRLNPDAETVRALVAAQFPHWAGLAATPVTPGGWDNRTFRLGERLAVRLPSAARYAPQVEKEHRWLPVLAPHLPLPVPVPVAVGVPGQGCPFPWSVRPWLDGEPAGPSVADLTAFARDLAVFLRALHAVPPEGAPAPGPHNFFRGGALTAYDAETREAVAGRPDAAACLAVWAAALASGFDGTPVWVHGDIAPGNLLVRDGRLAAVIDFGGCAVGDPACDLVIAWTRLDAPARAAFRAALGLDAGTWARARGWALWKAALILSGRSAPQPLERPAGEVLALVLAEGLSPPAAP